MQVLCERCAGLDVHKDTVVACARIVVDGRVEQHVETFGTTTSALMAFERLAFTNTQ
jgi:transposase